MIKNCLIALFILQLMQFCPAFELKDPKLIAGIEYKKINPLLQKKKSYVDKKEHNKAKQVLSKEEYEIYLITEKILRANNLQYKNWRIGFYAEKDILNAVCFNNNLIMLNSSLYDCLHQNKDALAFVISHEIAHFLLSHQKIAFENNFKISKIQSEIEKIESAQKELLQLNNFSKVINGAKPDEIKFNTNQRLLANLKNLINNIRLTQRELELDADSLALFLMIRAGYDFNSAVEIFDYFSTDYNFYENKNNYPMIYERIDNLTNEYELLDTDGLILEGLNSLLGSNALSVQKSMDKETIVINRPDNYKDYSFNLVSKNQKLTKKAYQCYKKGEIPCAIKYFEKAFEAKPDDFIAPLYLSLCYEYNYNKDGKKNDLKLAKKYIRKAKTIGKKPLNEAIIKQYEALYGKK